MKSRSVRLTRPILLAAALVLVASANLQATEALIFEGGGYNMQILVGMLDKPVVASVRLMAPGAKEWVSLPRELVQVEKFDMKKKILILHFSRQHDADPQLPRSLSFNVKKENAVLSIDGKKIKSSFSWEM